MGFMEVYDLYWIQYADPKVVGLPLMQSAIVIPFLSLLYLLIVLKVGPEFMKNRKPYELKTFIFWYNIFQIVINAYAVQQEISAGWLTEISPVCSSINSKQAAKKIAHTLWIIMLVKLVDFVETVVFVLRKKYNQVSFLHLYHHVSTVLICWLILRYDPGEILSFIALLNCTIHVIMYTYYLLSSFGPNVQKIINPFKPYITIMQMVQFVCMLIYCMQAFVPSCTMSKGTATVAIMNIIVNFTLFYNFYQKAYLKPAHKKE